MSLSRQRADSGSAGTDLDERVRADLEALLAQNKSSSLVKRGYAEGIAPRARAVKELMPDIVGSIAGAGVRMLTVAGAGALFLLLVLLFILLSDGSILLGLIVLLLSAVALGAFAPAPRIWLMEQHHKPVQLRWDREYRRTSELLRTTSIPELIVDHDTWNTVLGVTKGTGLGWLTPQHVDEFEDALVFAAWHLDSLSNIAAGQREPEGSLVLDRHMQLTFFRSGKGHKLAYASDRVEPYARLAAICDFFADDFKELEAGFEAPRLRRHQAPDAGSLRKS